MSDTFPSRTTIKDTESFFYFVSQAHKIASAIYLITGLMNDREPLKWTLREDVLDAVARVSASFAANAGPSDDALDEVKMVLEKVMFAVETGARSKLISPMNKDIVLAEVKSFAAAFEAQWHGEANRSTNAVQEAINITPAVPVLITPRPLSKVYKGHSKGHTAAPRRSQETTAVEPPYTAPTGKDRQEKVINTIREKGEISIRDIASIIPDYSEKTIQRDLADLVAKGTVKRRGERRWTVYFL